jgi:hypothetical protein
LAGVDAYRKALPFDARENVCLFRGTHSNPQRAALHKMANQLKEAKVPGFDVEVWHAHEKPKSYIPMREQTRFKCLFCIDGWGWPDRLAALLLTGTVIIKQDSTEREWFVVGSSSTRSDSIGIKPLIHYIPISNPIEPNIVHYLVQWVLSIPQSAADAVLRSKLFTPQPYPPESLPPIVVSDSTRTRTRTSPSTNSSPHLPLNSNTNNSNNDNDNNNNHNNNINHSSSNSFVRSMAERAHHFAITNLRPSQLYCYTLRLLHRIASSPELTPDINDPIRRDTTGFERIVSISADPTDDTGIRVEWANGWGNDVDTAGLWLRTQFKASLVP